MANTEDQSQKLEVLTKSTFPAGKIFLPVIIYLVVILATIMTRTILSWWMYLAGFLVTILVIVLLFASFRRPSVSGAGIGKIFNLGRFGDWIKLIAVVIVVAFVLLGAAWYAFGTADYGYTASELQGMCSDNCKVLSDSNGVYVQLSGGKLTIPTKDEIGAVQVVWDTHEANITVGKDYEFPYEEVFNGYTPDSARTPKYLRIPKILYKGKEQWGQHYGKPVEKTTLGPDNLKINDFYLKIPIINLVFGGHPSTALLIGEANSIPLIDGTVPSNAESMTGDVIISSDSAKIWYVGVYNKGIPRIGSYFVRTYLQLQGK